jgi:hypothetical protein
MKQTIVQSGGAYALEAALAQDAGTGFEWHYGQIHSLGYYESGGHVVTISWEDGTFSSKGDLTNEQREVMRLAFETSGKIALLSDQDVWAFDYRFIRAMR